tara:strand:- start:253 stop:687 length:435 start_codon:yes stop_codon:yes gene_type:complete
MIENNFFKLKVKYLIQDPDKGSIKKKTSEYVLKAFSFTDAESSLLEYLKDEFEYNLVSCSKFNIQDVRIDETKEDYFKAKIVSTSSDIDNGKTSKIIDNYIIQGDTTEDVNKSIKQMLLGSVMDYKIETIQKTKIKKVFYEVNK